MNDETVEEYQHRVASAGGKANFQKQGKKGMSKIGKKGAKTRWKEKLFIERRKIIDEVD